MVKNTLSNSGSGLFPQRDEAQPLTRGQKAAQTRAKNKEAGEKRAPGRPPKQGMPLNDLKYVTEGLDEATSVFSGFSALKSAEVVMEVEMGGVVRKVTATFDSSRHDWTILF